MIVPKEPRKSGKDASKQAQKKPHGSFEVVSGCREHDIDGVSEKSFVKVPSQMWPVLKWLISGSMPARFLNNLCFFVFMYAESESFGKAGDFARVALAYSSPFGHGNFMAKGDNFVQQFGVCVESDILLLGDGVDEHGLFLVRPFLRPDFPPSPPHLSASYLRERG